jgi:hypothetical protein
MVIRVALISPDAMGGSAMSVVEFEPPARPDREFWQCRCGSFAFWLSSDGSAHCSDCHEEAAAMQGYWRIAERDAPETSADLANVVFIFDGKGKPGA